MTGGADRPVEASLAPVYSYSPSEHPEITARRLLGIAK